MNQLRRYFSETILSDKKGIVFGKMTVNFEIWLLYDARLNLWKIRGELKCISHMRGSLRLWSFKFSAFSKILSHLALDLFSIEIWASLSFTLQLNTSCAWALLSVTLVLLDNPFIAWGFHSFMILAALALICAEFDIFLLSIYIDV